MAKRRRKRARTNPLDPLSIGLSASSLAYYMALARDLKAKRRKNPQERAILDRVTSKLNSHRRSNPTDGRTIAEGWDLYDRLNKSHSRNLARWEEEIRQYAKDHYGEGRWARLVDNTDKWQLIHFIRGSRNKTVAFDKVKKWANHRRSNPVNWSEMVGAGVGTAIGSAIGSAMIDPLIAQAQKHLKKRRKNGPSGRILKSKWYTVVDVYSSRHVSGPFDLLSDAKNSVRGQGMTWRRFSPGRYGWGNSNPNDDYLHAEVMKGSFLKQRGYRKNPTLLIAANPIKGGKKKNMSQARQPNKNLTGERFDPSEFEDDPEYQAALAIYSKFFYGDKPVEIIKIDAPEGTPKFLVSLGQAPEVTYQPPDHTSKRGVPFIHHFAEEGGEAPYLATDASGDYLGYVGGTFHITPDGIRD